jgi:hypothetical protein
MPNMNATGAFLQLAAKRQDSLLEDDDVRSGTAGCDVDGLRAFALVSKYSDEKYPI